jgi:hypothetical protein
MKINLKYTVIAVCILFVIVLVLLLAINKAPKQQKETPLYNDTVLETFDVTFLTENTQTNKEEYEALVTEYKNYILELEQKIKTNTEYLDLSAEPKYSEFKTLLPEYADNVIKAELYKKGLVVKDDIITTTENYELLNTYISTDNYSTISNNELTKYGIKEEEILRYFKVKNFKDNMIILCDNIYQVANTELKYSPKTIYVFSKNNDSIYLYGVYPVRLDTFDASFLNN